MMQILAWLALMLGIGVLYIIITLGFSFFETRDEPENAFVIGWIIGFILFMLMTAALIQEKEIIPQKKENQFIVVEQSESENLQN